MSEIDISKYRRPGIYITERDVNYLSSDRGKYRKYKINKIFGGIMK